MEEQGQNITKSLILEQLTTSWKAEEIHPWYQMESSFYLLLLLTKFQIRTLCSQN